jgi:phenylalanyl-tRNA synthetase beta chain
MNILIPDSWLRQYLDTKATPAEIQKFLSLCGPSIERAHHENGDTIYDIEVTTNRADCMSVVGIAREAAAILPRFDIPAKFTDDPFVKKTKLQTSPAVEYLQTKIDPKLCQRFSAVLIRNVTVKDSPEVIVSRLEKVGMRGLNNIIDVSNLLMHELGQPIHVFDYDKIKKHHMTLRESKKGETVITLDGKTHSLPGGDIIIEDGSGELIDLCGIMGGLNSAVTADTKNVLLFVQTYAGHRIRRTSMALAHRTTAAVLFEKDLPTESVLPTLEHARKLITALSGGIAEKTVLDILNSVEEEQVVNLDKPLHVLATQKIGVEITKAQTKNYLTDLGFKFKSESSVQVPFYRKFDVQIPEDLVEEVARIYGYHNIPPIIMDGPLPPPNPDRTFYWENRVKIALKYLGFTEVYSYSLVENDHGLKLKNPLSSDWAYLRTSLSPSHQKIISQNRGRVDELYLFEVANVYLPRANTLPEEQSRLIVSTTSGDFYRFKGQIEALLSDLGIGDIEPEINRLEDIMYWEIPFLQLSTKATDIKPYVPISKFAPVIEDINILHKGNYATLVKQIKSISKLVKNIELKDKFGDKLTIKVTFHAADHQLSSDEVAPVREEISKNFN